LRIEKGLPVLGDETKTMEPRDFLRRGIVTFFVGLGCVFAYFVVDIADRDARSWLGVLGSALSLYGLGNLLYYMLMPKHRRAEQQGAAADKH
jgi:hypothetical protein